VEEDNGVVGESGEAGVDAGDDLGDVLLGFVGLSRRKSDLDEDNLKGRRKGRRGRTWSATVEKQGTRAEEREGGKGAPSLAIRDGLEERPRTRVACA
jgi:hypothetical protein